MRPVWPVLLKLHHLDIQLRPWYVATMTLKQHNLVVTVWCMLQTNVDLSHSITHHVEFTVYLRLRLGWDQLLINYFVQETRQLFLLKPCWIPSEQRTSLLQFHQLVWAASCFFNFFNCGLFLCAWLTRATVFSRLCTLFCVPSPPILDTTWLTLYQPWQPPQCSWFNLLEYRLMVKTPMLEYAMKFKLRTTLNVARHSGDSLWNAVHQLVPDQWDTTFKTTRKPH